MIIVQVIGPPGARTSPPINWSDRLVHGLCHRPVDRTVRRSLLLNAHFTADQLTRLFVAHASSPAMPVRMTTGMYSSGIARTFSSPLRRIHLVPVPVNCLGYRFLPIPIPVGHWSGNRYPTGTAYPINKDTWGHSFTIGDVSSSPEYKCWSLKDAEEKERGCEEDEQRW